jgi:alkylhydroperoxidase family enzyme
MRLTYTDDPPTYPSDPPAQDFIDKLIADRKTHNLPLGALYRTILISPSLSPPFHDFFSAIRYSSTVPEDMRELAMCRVGAINGAAYEWAHHEPLMRKAGVSEEGAETVRTAERGRVGKEGEGGLSGRLWVVMAYCDAVTDMVVDDGGFERVKGVLGGDERAVLELSMFSAC